MIINYQKQRFSLFGWGRCFLRCMNKQALVTVRTVLVSYVWVRRKCLPENARTASSEHLKVAKWMKTSARRGMNCWFQASESIETVGNVRRKRDELLVSSIWKYWNSRKRPPSEGWTASSEHLKVAKWMKSSAGRGMNCWFQASESKEIVENVRPVRDELLVLSIWK